MKRYSVTFTGLTLLVKSSHGLAAIALGYVNFPQIPLVKMLKQHDASCAYNLNAKNSVS